MQTLIGGLFLAETLGFAGGRASRCRISRYPGDHLVLLSNEKAELDAVSVSYVQLCPSFRPRPRQWQWYVGELRVPQAAGKGANLGRPTMRTESFFMWRKANENRLSSIAVTIETAWPLLSSVGPLRRKHKIRALSTLSLAQPRPNL
jgi:hypothetical protein